MDSGSPNYSACRAKFGLPRGSRQEQPGGAARNKAGEPLGSHASMTRGALPNAKGHGAEDIRRDLLVSEKWLVTRAAGC